MEWHWRQQPPRLQPEERAFSCWHALLQGIELENPNARAADVDLKSGTESYFSEYGGFRSLGPSLSAPPAGK